MAGNDQSEIVRAIKGANRKQRKETFSYEDTSSVKMPGFKHIRNLNPEQVQKLISTLMKYRPNIYKIYINLGNYDKSELSNNKLRKIGSGIQRAIGEIAIDIADLLSDRRANVVEFLYEVTDPSTSSFNIRAQAYGTSEEQYLDDSRFNPIVKIEYFSNE